MGTTLYAKGIYLNACFDELDFSNPELVEGAHREYIKAGAEIIETNTFGANRYKLKGFGLEDKVADINRAGAAIARRAAGNAVLVAGSIGPLGLRIAPWGPTSAEEAEEAFREQARALLEGGVDFFILETFSDINEIHKAIQAVRSLGSDKAIVAEMTIGEDGNSLYGTTPEVFTAALEGWKVEVVGVNCSVGPAHMLECVEKMSRVTDLPLSAMPNAGVPRAVDGRNIYLCSPEYMAEYAKRFVLAGVKIVGGCCGTTPAHIKAMRAAIRALQPQRQRAIHVDTAPEETGSELRVPAVDAAQKSELAGKLAQGKFVVSMEVVPPRGHDPSGAVAIGLKLKAEGVDCVNIPDGPRASARLSPMALAYLLKCESGIEPILHYACRDRNLLGMQSDLLGMYALGIRNILIITGDPPKIGDYPDATAVFDVDSIGLTNVVTFLNRGVDIGGRRLPSPTAFLIGVGVNPGAVNIEHELARFALKVEAGAEYAITQPVFDVEVLKRFLASVARFRIPIIAGIWPLASLRNAEFMLNEVPGTSIPASVMERMRKAQDAGPERARAEGVALARETLVSIKGLVQGVQISPPAGRYELALEVLRALKE